MIGISVFGWDDSLDDLVLRVLQRMSVLWLLLGRRKYVTRELVQEVMCVCGVGVGGEGGLLPGSCCWQVGG